MGLSHRQTFNAYSGSRLRWLLSGLRWPFLLLPPILFAVLLLTRPPTQERAARIQAKRVEKLQAQIQAQVEEQVKLEVANNITSASEGAAKVAAAVEAAVEAAKHNITNTELNSEASALALALKDGSLDILFDDDGRRADGHYPVANTFFAFGAIWFIMYMVDFAFYGVIASIAILHERWLPMPGHPCFKRHNLPLGSLPTNVSHGKPKKSSVTKASQLFSRSYSSDSIDSSSSVEDNPKSNMVVVEINTPTYLGGNEGFSAYSSYDNKLASVPAELHNMYPEFPLVVIQLPMFNEEAYCTRVIENCCNIKWPRDKLIIQVCDDSNRQDLLDRIDATIEKMSKLGHNVHAVRRTNRVGFKAGSMVAGMDLLKDAGQYPKYIAIFDADFKPPEDFLYQTVYHMEMDPGVGFVQGRWVFDYSNSPLTWFQKVGLDLHFVVEQRARAFMRHFFGYNGTAGIWRTACIEHAGGWHSDTVVEDMDLSIRAYAAGWRFKYLHHVQCISELPSNLDAYKTQQYRWLAGPMQVIKKSIINTWQSKSIGFIGKMSSTYFFMRYINNGLMTVTALFVPPVVLWLPWGWSWQTIMFMVASSSCMMVYVPFTIFFFPMSFYQMITGNFKAYAMICGILGTKKSKSWKVTEKTGGVQAAGWRLPRPYWLEMALGSYYAFMALITAFSQPAGPATVSAYTLIVYSACMSFGCIVTAFGEGFV